MVWASLRFGHRSTRSASRSALSAGAITAAIGRLGHRHPKQTRRSSDASKNYFLPTTYAVLCNASLFAVPGLIAASW
jgi:hypothetical protein